MTRARLAVLGLLVLGLILFFRFGESGSVHVAAEQWVERGGKNLLLADRISAMTNAHGRDALLLLQVADQPLVWERIVERVVATDRLLDELEGRLADARDQELLVEIRARQQDFMRSLRAVVDLLAAGLYDDSSRRLVSETVPVLSLLQTSVSALNRSQAVVLGETAHASIADFRGARAILIELLVALAVVVAILSIWIMRLLSRRGRGALQEAGTQASRRRDETAAAPERTDGLPAVVNAMRQEIDLRGPVVLREDLHRFRSLVESLGDAVWEVDAAWSYTYISPQIEKILGYKAEELLGRSFFEPMPVDEALRMSEMCGAIRARCGPIEVLESEYTDRNGNRVVLERSGRPFFDEQGRLLGYRGFDRDVTRRKEIEEARMAEAARLRDTLVREVHHRIKNNLQTVTSLLRRQADLRPELAEVIDVAIGQVGAVAVVHGLYGRVTQHRVLLDELLSTLINTVRKLTGVLIVRENLAPETPRLLVRENETVALALILNELLTNAVKYSPTQPGTAAPRVVLGQDGEEGCVRILNIGELPENFDFQTGEGVGSGLGLVRALMPSPGMTIAFRQSGLWTEVEVRIRPPVIDTSPRCLQYV